MRVLLVCLLILLPTFGLADENFTGTVVLVSGHAKSGLGSLNYARPAIGTSVPVYHSGIYHGSFPDSIETKVHSLKPIQLNQNIAISDVLQTQINGYIKILFSDQSILDLGPHSTALVKEKNHIHLGTGKFRVVLSSPLQNSNAYEVETPFAQVYGREGAAHSEFYIYNDLKRTQILCLHGQVTVDLTRHTKTGLIYTQPIVLSYQQIIEISGPRGLGLTVKHKKLSETQTASFLKTLGPLVNQTSTELSKSIPATKLKGTAYIMPPTPPLPFIPSSLSQNFEQPHNVSVHFNYEGPTN